MSDRGPCDVGRVKHAPSLLGVTGELGPVQFLVLACLLAGFVAGGKKLYISVLIILFDLSNDILS